MRSPRARAVWLHVAWAFSNSAVTERGVSSEEGHLLDHIFTVTYTSRMAEPIRKITVNVPERLLEGAMGLTGMGITPTIIAGLEEIRRREKRSALRKLRGKVRFDLDLEETRR